MDVSQRGVIEADGHAAGCRACRIAGGLAGAVDQHADDAVVFQISVEVAIPTAGGFQKHLDRRDREIGTNKRNNRHQPGVVVIGNCGFYGLAENDGGCMERPCQKQRTTGDEGKES